MKSAFIISNSERNQIDADYTVSLKNNYKLNYFKDIDIEIINSNLIIIGIAVNKEQSIDILEQESQKDIQDLEKIYEAVERWSGRWILIIGKTIFSDPINSLNLFYGRLSEYNYISNSLGLLKKVGFSENQEIYNPNEKDEINWNISPFTRLNNVKILLPFEILDFSKFSIKEHLRFLRIKGTANIEELKNFIIQNNTSFQKLGLPINLALTAGYDSRFLFAGLLISKVAFNNITFVDSTIKIADYKVAQRISKANFVNYKIYKMKLANRLIKGRELRKLIDSFDLGNCQEKDRQWFINGMYNKSKPELIFRGNIGTEIFQGHKNYLYYPIGDGSFDGIINSLKIKYPGLNEFQIEDLKKWWECRNSFINNNDLDWRLIFWLDQRCCAWAGSINTVFDLSGFKAVNPLNSDWVLNWLSNYTNQGNIENGYQKILIENFRPDLNHFEYNPKNRKNLFSRLVLRLNNLVNRWY